MKKAKIVVTLGPATRESQMIEKLIFAGANVFRLNFSHSSYEEHKIAYHNIRSIADKYGISVAILADMQGPKLRVGKFKNGSEVLKEGQSFNLCLDSVEGDSTMVQLPHKEIFDSIKEGHHLLVDDGKIKLLAERCGMDIIETKVIIGGVISNAKGVNFPEGLLKMSPLTDKDAADLEFALSLGVDYIGLSFVQSASDVDLVKAIVKDRAKIIAKIEKPLALENLESIVSSAHAIMIARGDLGVEIPVESVPKQQKRIIEYCRRSNTPVIVATQMLDSMTYYPFPTRAEASDVANALYDGADAVMLSSETTVGKYPLETVNMMSAIIREVEKDPFYWKSMKASSREIWEDVTADSSEFISVGKAVALSARLIADTSGSTVIAVFSSHGTTVNRISNQRSKVNVISITGNRALYNQTALNWGVDAVYSNNLSSLSDVVDNVSSWVKKSGLCKLGDKLVIVGGVPLSVGGLTNTIRVIEIEE